MCRRRMSPGPRNVVDRDRVLGPDRAARMDLLSQGIHGVALAKAVAGSRLLIGVRAWDSR